MPLSARSRIEVYLPESTNYAYRDLLSLLEREFTHAFGGCTVASKLRGNYLSRLGVRMRDRINVLHTDTSFSLDKNLKTLEAYADKIRAAIMDELEEEDVLIVVWQVFHAT